MEKKIINLKEQIIQEERLQVILFKHIDEFKTNTYNERTQIYDNQLFLLKDNLSKSERKKLKKEISILQKKIRKIEKDMDINYKRLTYSFGCIPRKVSYCYNLIFEYQKDIRWIDSRR
jgi:hypothetical protein